MQESDHGHVVELAIFKAKEGVTRGQLLGTVDAVSEWAKQQPGFVSRDLTYSADNDTWIDVVWWDSMDSAHKAAEVAMTSESCAPMFSLIDLEGTQMLHGERVIDPVMAEKAPVGA
jgi:hypothetical protein